MQPLKPGQLAERRRWSDLDKKSQTNLLGLMPAEVRARVQRGDELTEQEVEAYIRKYYDISRRYVLWKVSDKTGERTRMRTTVQDTLESARKEMERKHGRQVVKSWSDLDFMTMRAKPPAGHRWLMTTEILVNTDEEAKTSSLFSSEVEVDG